MVPYSAKSTVVSASLGIIDNSGPRYLPSACNVKDDFPADEFLVHCLTAGFVRVWLFDTTVYRIISVCLLVISTV